MSEQLTGKWGYSTDGSEQFHGEFDTPQEAAMEVGRIGDSVTVGRYRKPITEGCIDAAILIDHIKTSEDYDSDFSEGWCNGATDSDLDELTYYLRAAFGAWLDRHELRPAFYVVENIVSLEIKEKQP